MDLIFFFFFLGGGGGGGGGAGGLYTEFTSNVSQDSGSIFCVSMETCNMGIGEKCSCSTTQEQNVLEFFKNSTFLNFSRTVSSRTGHS